MVAPNSPEAQDGPLQELESWLSFRDMSMEQVIDALSATDEHIRHNRSYYKATSLTVIHNPDAHPGRFYFRNGEFVLLYVGSSRTLEQLDQDTLTDYLGGPGVMLRSRAGKLYMHHVYPEEGIAFSSSGDKVSILEIFPPMTLDQYKDTYYEEPPPFIR